MDSDKDGKSNGEELGDPNCTWQPGQTPAGHAIGHPGIFSSFLYFSDTQNLYKEEYDKCKKKHEKIAVRQIFIKNQSMIEYIHDTCTESNAWYICVVCFCSYD